jgi:hypothetical protein
VRARNLKRVLRTDPMKVVRYMTPPVVSDFGRLFRENALDEVDLRFLDVLKMYQADCFGVVPIGGLHTGLFYYDQMKELRDVPGDIHEYGVFRGSMLSWLHSINMILSNYQRTRKVVGFDLFGEAVTSKNLDAGVTAEEDLRSLGGFTKTSKAMVERKVKLASPDHQNFELVEGDVMETLPIYLKRVPNKICMAICDVDWGKPTYEILRNVWGKVSIGGRIYFDEYSFGWTETEYVDKFLKEKGLTDKVLTRNASASRPTAYLTMTEELRER